jgi:glutaredoxin 2
MYTLYHYEHCPFCVRVRMAFGLLDISYKSQVLAYDDKTTPEKLTGKKMLPIIGDGKMAMNESLDIIEFFDKSNTLKIKEVTSAPNFKEFEAYISFLSNYVHSLAMPYWIWTPEFDESSRKYFQEQKEKKRGPFKDLVKNRAQFSSALENEWPKLENNLHPFYQSDKFTVKDILLASHLWGLYVVPEFQFPPKIHQYLQSVKNICKFDYHQDFWR